MEAFFDNLTGLVAVVCSLGIPIIVILMVFIRKMKKDNREKEVRQLIIENHTDPETAKLLIDEPKKAKEERKLGPINVGTLRWAFVLLGIGLGAGLNWLAGLDDENFYFFLLIAFGIGVGLLCSFLTEMHLYKKYGQEQPAEKTEPIEE